MTAKSEQRDAIVDELLRHGVKVEEFGHGGKHPWLMFRAPNGARMKMIYILGTSTPHHIANARADVRRRMRALNIKPVDKKGEKIRTEPVPIKAKPFEMPPLTEATKPVGYATTAIYDVVDRLPRNPVRIERPEPVDQPSMFPVASPVSVAPPAASPAPTQEAKAMTDTTIPGRKDRVVMTRLQIVKAATLLDQNSSERDGARSYNNGYSDASIAKMVRTDESPIDPSHIANLRREIYPNFRFIGASLEDGTATPTRAQLLEMVKDLRTRVEALEAIATAPGHSEHSNGVVKRLRELGAAG